MKKSSFDFSFKTYISGIIRALVVSLLIIMQIVFIIGLALSFQDYSVYMYFGFDILSLILIITLLNQNTTMSYKFTWICLIFLLPLSGHIMYILWGSPNSNKKMEERAVAKLNHGYSYVKDDDNIKEQLSEKYPALRRMSDYMSSEHFPLYANNDLKFYSMGEHVFEEMLNDMEKAKKFIFIDFFIVAEGKLLRDMIRILKRKQKEGVEIKILYDDFGSMFRTHDLFKEELESYGFEVRIFNPIHKYMSKLYLNYRSHHKIVVIDGDTGYTGGMNLADEYTNTVRRFGVWKDTGIRVTGDVVWSFTVTFLQMWDISSKDSYLIDYDKYRSNKKITGNDTFCHFISDGPDNNPDNPIYDTYIQMCNNARKILYITTPYLILDDEMQDELIRTAKSGVDVRIITPGIPDKKVVKMLTEYNYGPLLEAGVKIYEYIPGFIHSKIILNECSAIVGTINMDYRSFYLHYECGLWMCDENIVKDIRSDFYNTLSECREISYNEWLKRPMPKRIAQRVLNIFQTLL